MKELKASKRYTLAACFLKQKLASTLDNIGEMFIKLIKNIQNNAKARILLKEKRANVKSVKPFNIQLNYKTKTEYTQSITLGVDYQQGEQMVFWNLREYILHRDNHKCQNPTCKNKDKNPILEIHHILYRRNGETDTPSNLITLCNKCHTSSNHKKGKILDIWQTEKPKIRGFKDSTFMSMVRWKLIQFIDCSHTYGYITKNNRIKYEIEKLHFNDAFIIANGNIQERIELIIFDFL